MSAHYLSNRKLTKEENAAIKVLSLQPKTKYVEEIIKRKFVTLQDLHNLKRRLKSNSHAEHKDEQLLLELESIFNTDMSLCSCVIVSKDTLEVLLSIVAHKNCFKSFLKYCWLILLMM